MVEKISRRDLIKRAVRAGLVVGGIAAVGTAGYKMLRRKSIDELYGPYPGDSGLKSLNVSNPSAPKPNVIIIYCDDLGYGDLGCYGNRAIRTPNIDRLARDGIMFTDYYACNAVCAPSRAGLLTGRHPFRTGIIGNPYPADSPLLRRLERKIAYIFTPLGSVDLHEAYVADALIEAATAHSRAAGWDMVSCLMLSHSPYVPALKRRGFILVPPDKIPQEMHLGARSTGSMLTDEFVCRVTNWYITWGDHDRI